MMRKLFWFHNISLVENQQKTKSKEMLIYTSLGMSRKSFLFNVSIQGTFFQQLPKPLRVLLLLVTVNIHSLISLCCDNFPHIQAICSLETFSFSVLFLTI